MNINANAKINLGLDVVGKRHDGFHEVNMIMQTLEFGDLICVEKTPSDIELDGTGNKIEYNQANLAYKTAQIFFETSKIKGGVRIFIDKKIPVCAGLAGGSSDAAAVLVGLNEIYQKPFKLDKLLELGALIGSDVPFCIIKGTAKASGRGEIITPLQPIPVKSVVFVKPPIDVSTPLGYKMLDGSKYAHPNIDLICKMINNNEFEKSYNILENVFETVIFKIHPEVEDIKRKMLALGADTALMSGSGPTVFGIFENEKSAILAYNDFKLKYEETIITKTYNV